MKQEQRIVCFKETLDIEAYRFIGVMQKFPNHSVYDITGCSFLPKFTTTVAYQSE